MGSEQGVWGNGVPPKGPREGPPGAPRGPQGGAPPRFLAPRALRGGPREAPKWPLGNLMKLIIKLSRGSPEGTQAEGNQQGGLPNLLQQGSGECIALSSFFTAAQPHRVGF